MDGKINADIKFLKFILSKNKVYILPIAVIMVSIILLFQFIVPQFNALLAVQKDAKDSSQKLEILKANLDILANVNEEILDSQLEILNSALPADKNFIDMLDSLYSTAQKTGVSLGTFSFKVGDLGQSGSSDSKLPVVDLSLPVSSSIIGISNFIVAITKTLPLSDVYTIKAGNVSSSLGLSFYYKLLDASSYAQDLRVRPVSQKGLTLINKLKEFSTSKVDVPPNTSLLPQ